MNREIYEENTLRRYLLGELVEEENARLEDAAFGDAELLARLESTENDLIDEYARGELAGAEKQNFERMFLTSPERRKRIEFARSFATRLNEEKSTLAAAETRAAQTSERKSFWQTLSGFLGQPQFAFGALALLVLIAVVFWFSNSRKSEIEIARQGNENAAPHSNQTLNSPNNRAAENSTSSNLVNQNFPFSNAATPNVSPSPNISRAPEKSNQNKPANAQPPPHVKSAAPAPIFATLVFPVGMTRDGGGKVLQLNLAPNAKGARFVFNLDAGDDEYKNYEIELRGKSGAFASKTRAVRSGRAVAFSVSADKLPAGRYEAVLRGVADENQGATIGYYDFEIVKP